MYPVLSKPDTIDTRMEGYLGLHWVGGRGGRWRGELRVEDALVFLHAVTVVVFVQGLLYLAYLARELVNSGKVEMVRVVHDWFNSYNVDRGGNDLDNWTIAQGGWVSL